MAKRYIDAGDKNYYPNDEALTWIPEIVDCLVAGCVPERPFIDKKKSIVAFGSCFADHVSDYLKKAGYNVATRGDRNMAYIASMGDGIVNTFAVLQQFEWAWLGKQPTVDLWYDYDARALGYRDEIRVETRRLLDQTDVFILTLGLSEVWYDEPTGEVFWRIVPRVHFDSSRHKFRTIKQGENLANLRAIVKLIHESRPSAQIVLTLSPVPLKVTYRQQSCLVANAASKASIRSALDELMIDSEDPNLFYFPSYELVRDCFNHPYVKDRRHVHTHVIEFVMSAFDHYFCDGISSGELFRRFKVARQYDKTLDDAPPTPIDDSKLVLMEMGGRLKKLGWRKNV